MMMMMVLVVQDEHQFIGVTKYLPMHGNDLMNQKKRIYINVLYAGLIHLMFK